MRQKNIVLTACAGSGKTYALIQRMLDLLKSGAAAGEILAITFTKKAAAEIETRLLDALSEKNEEWAQSCLRRILLAENMSDSLSVHTFHSWFGLLLAGQRWTKGWYGPGRLIESDLAIKEQAWLRWLKRMEGDDEAAPAEALKTVFQHCSPHTLKKTIVEKFTSQLNAWRLFSETMSPQIATDAAAKVDIAEAKEKLNKAAQLFIENAHGSGNPFNKAFSAAEDFLSEGDLDALVAGFLTKTGTVNSYLARNAQKHQYVSHLNTCVAAIKDRLDAQENSAALVFSAAMTTLATDYLRELEELKNTENLITFDDLEYYAYQAVRQYGDVNTMLYRINLKFRHILIDEFQDTSPLQWQIIRHWLHAAHGSDTAPSVFIVGDDKQAIYSFRQGDARLLQEAKIFLRDYYAAEVKETRVCRRCAPPILRWVNHTFSGRMDGFTEHCCADVNAAYPGRVEWHPPPPDDDAPLWRKTPRNPLRKNRQEGKSEKKRKIWATALAHRVRDIVGRWQLVHDNGVTRACGEEDILILLPQRTHIAWLAEELSQCGLSHTIHGGGVNFLHTLACKDILALSRVLLDAENSLSLATVLKSPIFAFNEKLFADVAYSGGEGLWEKLSNHPAAEACHAFTVLQRWRHWAQQQTLPAHDLLSKIYGDGDIIARYRGAVIPTMRRQVGDQLLALLDFSLFNDGGRQPLIGQFIKQAEVAARDNPPTIPGNNGVQLSTVHKAKGLEAPVVIVADTTFDKKYSGGKSDSVNLYIDWRPAAAAPQAFLFRPNALKQAFANLAEEQQQRRAREYQNLLYVAMTRAQQALLVFCATNDNNPLVEAIKPSEQGESWHDGEMPTASPPPSAATAETENATDENVAIGVRRPMAAARAGNELHLLAALTVAGLSPAQITAVAAPKDPTMVQQAQRMLDALQPLADADAQWLPEAEFAENGVVYRPDLLIINRDNVWVIDYKSGGGLSRYRGQLQNYRRLVTAANPDKTVQAALLKPDGTILPEETLNAPTNDSEA